jgi:hypothetical protein
LNFKELFSLKTLGKERHSLLDRQFLSLKYFSELNLNSKEHTLACMKHSKWIWLALGIASIATSVWRFATPYEVKASDPLSKVVIDTGVLLLIGAFGVFCLFRFVQLVKARKRQQNVINNFLKD